MSQQPLAVGYDGDAPRVTFRVPPGVIAGVDEVAARRGLRRSELVRLALEELLERETARPA
jgi:metal-responsive CopG/Arc/MetJ family transcriptional regulator